MNTINLSLEISSKIINRKLSVVQKLSMKNSKLLLLEKEQLLMKLLAMQRKMH